MPEPTSTPMPKLSLIKRGISKCTNLSRPRLPITPAILRQMKALWLHRADQREVIMMWAVAVVCFFGFFRLGELTAKSESTTDVGLLFSDVSVDSQDSPTTVALRLRRSKTDQVGKGVHIYLGSTGDDLCPVAALLAYIAIRGGSPGPLFCHPNGKPLTRTQVIAATRQALVTLGLDSQLYAGHSFRTGAATTAAECGLEDSLIKALGRWKSEAFHLYIKTPRDKLAQIPRILSTHGTPHFFPRGQHPPPGDPHT